MLTIFSTILDFIVELCNAELLTLVKSTLFDKIKIGATFYVKVNMTVGKQVREQPDIA